MRVYVFNSSGAQKNRDKVSREALSLCADFFTPKDLDSIPFEELGDVLGDGYLSSESLRTAIDSLIAHEILVPVERSSATSAEGASARVAQSIAVTDSIARLTHHTIADLSGFGSYLHGDGASGIDLNLLSRLEEVQSSLSRIVGELNAARAGYLRKQLEQLGIGPDARDLRLHVGCGPRRIPGWVNIDVAPAELALNVDWGLPFGDGSCQYVYFAHLFEHLYYKGEALRFAKELRRVLAPGAVLRIALPDIGKLLDAYSRRDEAFFEERKRHWRMIQVPLFKSPLEHILRYSGAGLRPGDLIRHRYGYDFETLGNLLREAGFTDVIRSEFMKSSHEPLRVDNASEYAQFEHKGLSYSMFVEAV